MKDKKKWEVWMGTFLLIAVLLLSTMGIKKTVQDTMAQKEEQKIVVLDAGHGAYPLR